MLMRRSQSASESVRMVDLSPSVEVLGVRARLRGHLLAQADCSPTCGDTSLKELKSGKPGSGGSLLWCTEGAARQPNPGWTLERP